MAQVAIPLAVGFATSVLSSLLTPTQKQKGPRIETNAPKSEYGYAIADIYGRVRIQGCLCHWGLNLKEVKKKKKKGGKGGGVVTETYSYYLTAAFLIASEVTAIKKVWCNGVQVFEEGSSKDISERFEDFTEFHLGTPTQSVSPTIDAYVSSAFPAFRYRSYIVFNQYPIKDFDGNGYPRVDAEVIGKFGEDPSINLIIADICEKAGLTSSEYNVSQIPSELKTTGIRLRNDSGNYGDVLLDLQKIYFLLSREANGVIHFFPQKVTQILTFIELDSLGAKEFTSRQIVDRYIQKIIHERELPSEVQVDFINRTNNFDPGFQYARNPSSQHNNPLNIRTEVVATDPEMASVASKILYQSQIQKHKYQKISLLPAWGIEIGEVVTLPIDGLLIPIQIGKKVVGNNYLIELEGVRYGTAYEVDSGALPETEILLKMTVSWRSIATQEVLVTRFWTYRKTFTDSVNSVIPVWSSNWTVITNQNTTSWFGFHLGTLDITASNGSLTTINAGSTVNDVQDTNMTGEGQLRQAIPEGIAKNRNEPANVLFGDFSATIGTPCEARIDEILIQAIITSGGLGDGAFNYTQDVEPEYNPAVIPTIGTANAIALDIPLVNDSDDDIGIYVAVEGDSNWRDGVLYVSLDSGVSYQAALELTANSVTGIVAQAIPSASTTVPDTTTTFTLAIGGTGQETVEPVTNAEFSQGLQVALVGNEVIWFRDVVQTGTNPNVYTISHLMRGRRGTEAYTAGHTTNERFILLSDYLERLVGRTTDLGTTVRLKAVGGGNAETDVTTYTTATLAFNSLKPYAPVNATATKDNAGNIYLGWTRRDRHAGDRTDYSAFPLSETTESYEIDIMNGVVVERTLTSATPSVTYLVADQVTDFGSVQSSVTIKVYQVSTLYGRGFPLVATLTPTLSPVAPAISGFSPTQGNIGDTITIFGSSFTGATAIAVNGTNVTGLTVVSDTEATGVIDTGTTSGLITIATAGGTGASPTTFIVGAAGYTDEQAVDAVATALVGSDEINWSYDDAGNAITASLKEGSILASKFHRSSLETLIYSLGIIGAAYTDEQAVDAVATALVGSDEINWNYDDAGNAITASLKEGSILASKFHRSSLEALIYSLGIIGYTDEQVDDRVASLLQAGSNITLSYNDASNTLTISSGGGSSGVASLSSLYTDLSVYFPLDGSYVDSISGFALTPTAQSTGLTFPSGKIGSCLNADGDGYAIVDIGAANQINVHTPFTISAWISLSDVGNVNYRLPVIIRNGAGANMVWFDKDNSSRLRFMMNASEGAFASTSLVTANTFFHMAGVYHGAAGQRAVIYINGVAIASTPVTATFTFNNSVCNFQIFSNVGTNNHPNDKVDEVGFWKRALTGWEIRDLYNLGNGLVPSPITVTPTIPVSSISADKLDPNGLANLLYSLGFT